MAPLDRAAIAAVDTDGILAEVLDLPEHLRDALWRVESAGIRRSEAGALVVVGVDGLQAGARLAPVDAEIAADVPESFSADQLVLLMSYSGDDAPVLAAFEAATEAGASLITLTTGGRLAELAREAKVPVIPLPGGFLSPRLALGYPLAVTLAIARLAGLSSVSAAEVEGAADHVATLVGEWGPDAPQDSALKSLASEFGGREVSLGAAGLASLSKHLGSTPTARAASFLLLGNLIEVYRAVLAGESPIVLRDPRG
jgi:glucose/mannose-6-phosphate isomerase